jgi:cytoskeleton protein RodZ
MQLDTQQLEQLRNIGSYLGQIRQDQAKSLEDIAAKTYIPLRLVKAIETAQIQVLPEPVYIKGLIQRYAEALGLNGKEVSQRFSVNPASPVSPATVSPAAASPAQTVPAKTVPAKAVPAAAVKTPETTTAFASQPVPPAPVRAPVAPPVASSPTWEKPIEVDPKPAKPPLGWLIGVASVAIAGLFFSVIKPALDQMPGASVTAVARERSRQASEEQIASSSSGTTSDSNQANVALPSNPDAVNRNDAVDSEASKPDASKPEASNRSTPNKSTQPVTIDVTASEEAWIEVMVDGKVAFEGTLQKGDRKSWSAKERLRISSGNAGAVKVAFNNGQAKPMGELGAVKEQTYTRKTKAN